jgi:hypothetical protein
VNENNQNQGGIQPQPVANADFMIIPQSTYIGGGTISGSSSIIYQGPTGISCTYQQNVGSPPTASKKRIGPKLYFNYVKSKLTKTQTKRLRSRLQKLQSLVKSAEENGQKALYETFSRMLVVAVREASASACGYDVYVDKADIEKFRYIVTENPESHRNPVYFKKLEEFSRPIPAKVAKVIKSVQSKGLFDELHVLYLDYTNEVVKSTKEKIREKDPVLFGKFSYDDSRYFFITDWIDDHCDLTLSKFVDTLKENNKEYETQKLEDITPEYLERIKLEINEREERLKTTNPSNYRANMAEEDRAELKRLKEENSKLRDEKHFLDEDKEIAVEKAIAEERRWKKEGSKEDLVKKPWYKRLF